MVGYISGLYYSTITYELCISFGKINPEEKKRQNGAFTIINTKTMRDFL